MTFTFSIGNVSELCLHLGIIAWLAWPIGASVDFSVTGLLTGLGFLAQHSYTDAQLRKPRDMLLFCGCLTLTLNIADAISRRQVGTALVDAVGPALLIGWSEVGQYGSGVALATSFADLAEAGRWRSATDELAKSASLEECAA